jgi:hypothetical protein
MHRRTLVASGLAGLLPGIGRAAAATPTPTPASPAAPAPAAASPAAIRPSAPREALLIPGKRSLRQRVLSRPGVVPAASPGAAAAGAALPPLTQLFVFAEANAPDGTPWIEVGRGQRGATLGWLAKARAIPWYHTLTASFRNPAGREPTLFFRERAPLIALLGGQHAEVEAHKLATIARHPPVPADFPVIAAEPETYVDILKSFYLLPILKADMLSMQDGRQFTALEVASLPLTPDPPPATADFTVGVAFVIDTTQSMDPYIDRVRDLLNTLVTQTSHEPGHKTRYALVGFRNNLAVQPRLEYLTKVFARFADNADPEKFRARIADVHAAHADSLSFSEDSFAGVMTAVQDLDWGDIAAKVIVLVTDAASRPANDPHSSTRMTAAQIGEQVHNAGAALMVLHLLTPAGAANHAFAASQYRVLSSVPFPNLGPQYFPVATGDANAMQGIARKVTEAFRAMLAQPNMHPPAPAQAPGEAQHQAPDPQRQAALLGYAMRLAWLGRRDRAAAPDIVRGWTTDGYRGRNPGECLEVRVLLSRNQLNDLSQSLQWIVDHGREAMPNPGVLFDDLQTVSAHLLRDPERLRAGPIGSLGDLLGEYLDDLPYLSRVALMDRDTWLATPGSAQDEFLTHLDSYIRTYHQFEISPIWTNLLGSGDRGDEVFPVPLSLLP